MREKRPVVSKHLPTKLRLLRKEKGWSQGQLAQKNGADQHRISKYENSTVFPTVDVLVKFATVFDVSFDYLVRDKEDIDLSKIPNQELARKIDTISRLGKEEQPALNLMIDALIKKQKLEEIVQGLI